MSGLYVNVTHPDLIRIERYGYLPDGAEPVYTCKSCDIPIYAGDRYARIDDKAYCLECLEEIYTDIA